MTTESRDALREARAELEKVDIADKGFGPVVSRRGLTALQRARRILAGAVQQGEPSLDVERIERVKDKAERLRAKTKREAISGEDWQFLNGYEYALYDLGILVRDHPAAARLRSRPSEERQP